MNERTNTFFAKKHNHDGKRNYLQNMTNKKNGLFSLTWVHRFGWVHVAHLISYLCCVRDATNSVLNHIL
jgi:hypothetical protein